MSRTSRFRVRISASVASVLGVAAILAAVPLVQAASPERSVDNEERGVSISSLPSRKVPPPSVGGGTFVARILINTAVRSRPGGDSVRWLARVRAKWSGSGQKLMVLGSRKVGGKEWIKVRLPIRPNGSAGWMPRDRVVLIHTDSYVEIDRSERLLRVYSKGRMIRRWKVVVGAPVTPTPLGLFALYDRVRQRDTNGFIGPWALPLTAHSNELRRYEGGPGLVAIHGRAGSSLFDPLGTAASHGCVRMNNSRVRYLLSKSMGTAVRIRR